ncbi:MAG: TlpA disulfide reductase family protein [Bdellovibrionota bacterium]
MLKSFRGILAVTALIALCSPIDAQAKIKKGDAFPAGAVPALNGKGTVEPAKHKGKVVIVDFWASWCEPCKIELPALNALYKKYKSKGLVVIGVNLDEKKADATGFLKEHPVDFPLGYDGGEKKVLAEQAEIETMPTSFIVDKKGVISERHQAFRAGDEKKIEALIVKLLKEK